MLKNYLKITFRNLVKHKIYSFINISGLAVGMASVILIGSYILDELSYDRYHQNADRIYRFTGSSSGDVIPGWIGTSALLGPTLKAEFPEIENYVRFDPFGFKEKTLISYKDKSFYEDRFYLSDPALFKVFDFKLLRGNPETVLVNPTDLVITKSMAEKYFGSEDPIGKVINYDGNIDFTVTGVMKDVPQNSHFVFDFVAPFEHMDYIHQRKIMHSWGMHNYYTYILLQENVKPEDLETKSAAFLAEFTNNPDISVYLQPLTEIYLRSKIARDEHHRGDITNIYLYSAIAVVILLIACINFMNLYTANSEIRAREVGMRKVLGAHKKHLLFQFLGEALIFSTIALPVAILLVESILPSFNQITDKSLQIDYSNNLALFSGLFIMTIVVGLVSGSYPAFFISAFQPTKMLQGKLSKSKKGFALRNLLVVFQFAISIVLIVGTFTINSQMQFIRNKKLGYDRENIVNVPIFSPETKTKYAIFRNEILTNPNILDATATSFTPSVERWREGTYFEGRKDTDEHSFFRMSGDYNLLDLFGMEIIEGRRFNRNFPGDLKNAWILNESAVKEIGWANKEAIGKGFGNQTGRIIGVVKDFNFRSLRRKTAPLAINVLPGMFQYISIKIKPSDIPNTIQFIENKWRATNPDFPFEYYFYDDEFDKLYKTDIKLEILFKYFTLLAIFIACLGLFGLASFMTRQRTKEIGVRKVLGSSISGIVILLSREFTKWVLFANLIAWPIAFFTMKGWLQNFAYRIDLDWMTFVLSGALALAIALLTVSYQAIKSAVANPIDSLRYE